MVEVLQCGGRVAQLPAERRYFSTTRGQVLALLRQRARTVEELRRALGLTENAVRHQLAVLQKDGLVRQVGSRPGVRRPAAVFGPTPEAERFFSKPYAPLLRLVLDSLAERLPPAQRREIARDVGKRLAGEVAAANGGGAKARRVSGEARLTRAVRLLAGLGGSFAVEEEHGRVVLRGTRCPLAVVHPAHTEVCVIAEAFLAEVLSAPISQVCAESSPPRCAFVVGN